MGNISQGEVEEERTAKPTEGGGSRISRSGGKRLIISTELDAEKLQGLSEADALVQARERLSAFLVLYQNLGGTVTAVTLPEGKSILGRRDLIILPAVRDQNSGTYSLYVPE